MDSFQTDWLLVVIAAILNSAIGFVWYSEWLFLPIWLKLTGMKGKEMKYNKRNGLFGLIVSLVIAYFLSFFQWHLGVTSVSDGMLVGLFLWLGFDLTAQISGVIWNRVPLKLFAINSGYKLISFLVMSGIIAA